MHQSAGAARWRPLLALLLLIALAACARGVEARKPVGGQPERGAASPSAEDEREKLEAARSFLSEWHGGTYRDAALTSYVQEVAIATARASDYDGPPIGVTLLDSPRPNAFVFQDGKILVTRGLLAFLDNEDELAAVLAHELAHLSLRHQEQRRRDFSRGSLGTWGDRVAFHRATSDSERLEVVARLVSSYSQTQELAADRAALETLRTAGRDPAAMVRFLERLRASRTLPEVDEPEEAFGTRKAVVRSHPPTDRRIVALEAELGGGTADAAAEPAYLARLDGLRYGTPPGAAEVRGRLYLDPRQEVALELPMDGFEPGNFQQISMAFHPSGVSIFVAAAEIPPEWRSKTQRSLVSILEGLMEAADWRDERIETPEVGSRVVFATATLPDDQRTVVTAAAARIGNENRAVLLTMLAKADLAPRLRAGLELAAESATTLVRAEARGQHLRIAIAEPGDTVAGLAARMPQQDGFAEDRFRVLNGLAPGQEPRPGDTLKLLVE